MDKLVRIAASHRGEESLEDSNHFRYCNNGQGMFTCWPLTGDVPNVRALQSYQHVTLLEISPAQLYQNTTTLDNKKFILDGYDTMPKNDLITILACS